MNPVELVQKYKTRAVVIWMSCFDEARSLKEIADVWGYSSPNVLHMKNLPQKMVDAGFLKIEGLRNKAVLYKSRVEPLFPLIEYEVENSPGFDMSRGFYRDFLRDKEIILPVLDSEEFRKTFLSLEDLVVSVNKKTDLIGNFSVAGAFFVMGYSMITALKVLGEDPETKTFPGDIKENFDKIKEHMVLSLLPFCSGGSTSPEYLERVMEKLNYEIYHKLSKDAEKTKLYKSMKRLAKKAMEIREEIQRFASEGYKED